MPTCIVCLETLKNPAALPCGHVFCYDCVIRLVRSVNPYTPNHFCPTCKHPYTILNVDPNLIPHHLRHHVTPAVRKLNLEYTVPIPQKTSASNAECARLLAENTSLKDCCVVWRKRAAVHATATMAFVGLARLARDYGMKMKKERDELEEKYNELKRLYDEKMSVPDSPPETPSCPPSPRSADLRAGTPPLPRLEPEEACLLPSIARLDSEKRPSSPSRMLYRLPSPALSDESFCSECPDCVARKRKYAPEDAEGESPERPIKRSHSASPSPVLSAPVSTSPGAAAIASYLEDSLTL